MSVRDFFGVVGRRRRRSSVISLFRHRDGPVKKIKFSPFFKNKQSFQNSRFLGKMSAQDFFCCCRSSVIRHFPLSSQGRTCEKNQIFAVFQKQAIFPKFKIFRQNECTRFFRRRRSSLSSVVVISLFRHRDRPVKKIKFSPFFKNKQSFQNSRFLGKMSARDFFCRRRSSVVGRPSFPSVVKAVFHGPVKKTRFFQIFAVFQKQAIFPKFKIFGQNECTRFFCRRRSSPCWSSVISLFRHRDRPVEKIKFSPFFKNKQSFQNSIFLGKLSVRDFFGVVGRRRGRSSVISLFRHRDGPVKKSNFRRFSKTSNHSKIQDFWAK